jgi:hypothetical protein
MNGGIDAFVPRPNEVAVDAGRPRSCRQFPGSAYDLEFVAVAHSPRVQLVTNDKQVLAEFLGIEISPEAFAA